MTRFTPYTVRHGQPLARFDAAEEALADEALLALFKLRDRLVHRNANSLACRVDEQMEALESLARSSVAQLLGEDRHG